MSDCGCGCNGSPGGCGLAGIEPPPRRLTPDEIEVFMIYHGNEPALRDYISTGEPEWGIIVESFGASILVWYEGGTKWSGSGSNIHTHVIAFVDVTGRSIVEQVKKAPFVSINDDGFFANLHREFNSVFGKSSALVLVAILGFGILQSLNR